MTVVPNGKLSALLSAIHGAGMGYLTRVATLERGDLLPQLQRAGIPISQAPSLADVEQVLFVNAGGRSVSTATLLLKHGATRVWIVNSFGAWTVVDDVIVADSRIAAEPTKAARAHIPGRDAIPASPTESHPSSDSSPE